MPQAIEPFESIAIMPIVSYLISYCAGRRGIAHRTAARAPSALRRSTSCSAAYVAAQHMFQRGTCCNAAHAATQHSTASCGLPPVDGRVLTPIHPAALTPHRYSSPLCSA